MTPTQTQITLTVDDSLMKDLQSIRDRFAHQLPAGVSMAEVIRFMAKITLASAPEAELKRVKRTPVKANRRNSLPAPVVRSRYVPIAVKREVWKRDEGTCTYVSSATQKRCQSRHRLQIDHVVPFSRGGSSQDPDGLRLLCFAHNQHEATRVLGGRGKGGS